MEVPACDSLGHSVEELENNKKLHASMARIYPVLIGTFFWLMVGLVKTNSKELSLTRICERNTETYERSYFALHY